MEDDATLLRRFATEESDPAFVELVRRHIDYVYALALRHAAGDCLQAAAVVQHVFSRLAREAAKLPHQPTIAGWLHTAAGIAANEITHAPVAGPTDSPGSNPSERARWRAVFDKTLDELPEMDRSVVVLRHLEHRSVAEVGQAMDLGPDAAVMRIERAVGKWRGLLAKHGIVISEAELVARLALETLSPAPAGLANAIADVALTEMAASSENRAVIVTLRKVFNSPTALSGVAALAVVMALLWGHRTNAALQAEIANLRGDSMALAGMQRDIRRLSRAVDEADNLRREIAELPSLRATVAVAPSGPPVGTVSVTLLADGVMRWDREEITTRDFVRRIQDFRAQYPSADSLIVVHGHGASLPALAYVVDETRKARIKRIVVDGEIRPDPVFGGWF